MKKILMIAFYVLFIPSLIGSVYLMARVIVIEGEDIPNYELILMMLLLGY